MRLRQKAKSKKDKRSIRLRAWTLSTGHRVVSVSDEKVCVRKKLRLLLAEVFISPKLASGFLYQSAEYLRGGQIVFFNQGHTLRALLRGYAC